MTAHRDDIRRHLDRLPALTTTHGVPGVSVAVLADGEIQTGVAGVLNARTSVEVTPDSLFMIQSITKVWTATLVMQLVDDGLVDLDRPVRDYIPGFRTADEGASARITARHLLTHTGGFEGDLWAATTDNSDALEVFVGELVRHAPQVLPPGTRYSYCSAGYGVLGRLVEIQRRMPYPEAVRRHLTTPLGITDIAFSANEALGFRSAIGHTGSGRMQEPLRVWAVMPASNPAAGNQLAMSATALIRFAEMHLSAGIIDGARVLSADAVRAMQQLQFEQPGIAPTRQGLGWMLSSEPEIVGHGGDTIGVFANLKLVPERGIAVAVLTNSDHGSALTADLVGPLLRDLAGLEPQPPATVPAPGAEIPNPDRYVGNLRCAHPVGRDHRRERPAVDASFRSRRGARHGRTGRRTGSTLTP